MRVIIITKFLLNERELKLFENDSIFPFDRMLDDSQQQIEQESYWYHKYSRYKHHTEKLINVWTLKDSFYAMGCAYLLVLFYVQETLNEYISDWVSLSHYFHANPYDFFTGPKGWANIILELPKPKVLASK